MIPALIFNDVWAKQITERVKAIENRVKRMFDRLPERAMRWFLVPFELKTDLENFSTATAYVISETTKNRTANTITVEDLLGIYAGDGSTESGASGSIEGTGARGWAVRGLGGKMWVVVLSCGQSPEA